MAHLGIDWNGIILPTFWAFFNEIAIPVCSMYIVNYQKVYHRESWVTFYPFSR